MPITELLNHNVHLVLQGSCAAGLPGNFADFFSPSQPEPVLFPRKSLTQVFAVLLMRSAYEAVDDLNFIPMVRLASLLTPLVCNGGMPSDCALQIYIMKIWQHT